MSRFAPQVVLTLCGALVAVLLFACSGAQEESSGSSYGGVGGDTSLRNPEEDGRRCPSEANLIEESLDTSGDNVADVRKVYRSEGEGAEQRKILICREMDLNRDGRKDVFRFYNDDGRPLREMSDGDFDGQMDGITFFEEGRVVRQELDRNHDGNPDETRHYARELLLRVERDDNHDGQVDVWEHWARGSLLRIGYDVDGDQVADFWHRAPPPDDEEVEEPAADEADEEGEEEESDE